MPQIFALRNDGYKFQELDLHIGDLLDKRPANCSEGAVYDFGFNNTRLSSWWPVPDTEFIELEGCEGQPVPDLSSWEPCSLVLSPKAYRLLGELLQQWGEFLPITVMGEEGYYIFNCLTTGAVDQPKCEPELFEGEVVGIKKLAFDQNDVCEKILFKAPPNYSIELFCNDTIKHAIESFGLTGMICTEKLTPDYSDMNA